MEKAFLFELFPFPYLTIFRLNATTKLTCIDNDDQTANNSNKKAAQVSSRNEI